MGEKPRHLRSISDPRRWSCMHHPANRLDGRHQSLYEESRVTIRDLVKKYTANGQKEAWTGGDNLFRSLVRRMQELLVGNSRVSSKNIVSHLTKRCGMSLEVAKQVAEMVKSDATT